MTDSEDNEKQARVPTLCSQRWILAYIGFLGFGVVYSLRVNISVAVVCMVKTPVDDVTFSLYNNTTSLPENEAACVAETKEASHSNDRAELDWSQDTKSSILASFFYGYIVTQIPGGWLADRYGGKKILMTAILSSSILTLLTPVCARTSVYLVYAIRILLGLLTAVTFPAMHAMWGRWAPPLERSKLTTLCYAGTTLGNVLTFSTSGLLCEYGFDNGWGSIFYVTGGLGVLWSLAWMYISSDTPTTHPRISDEERKYISGSIEYKIDRKTVKVPWLSMLKSRCLWACLTAHVCNNWTNYTLLTNIPTFMRDVLKFDIKANGAVSAIPYICQFMSAIFAGHLADFLRTRNILSTTGTRKSLQILSFGGAAGCLIATGFCDCTQRTLAVTLLSLAVMFTGFCRAGYVVNHVDFAPKYAGVLFGITNTLATIPGMTAPLLAGYMTPDGTPGEWRNVFYVCAGFDAFGIIVFGLFASGEIQDWAKDEDFEVEIEVGGTNNIAFDENDVDNKDKAITSFVQVNLDDKDKAK